MTSIRKTCDSLQNPPLLVCFIDNSAGRQYCLYGAILGHFKLGRFELLTLY